MIGESPYNFEKLRRELAAIGYSDIVSINSNGYVTAIVNGAEEAIHLWPDVAAVIAAHDPTPDPPPVTVEERLEAAELMIDLLLDTQEAI